MRIGDALSRNKASISGVPQGSHLRHLLFALFVNDLVEVFNDCEVLMYADDLKFFRPVTSSAEAAVMESNLERVHEWCQRNMMDLNIAKCEVIIFSRRTESYRCIHDYNANHQPL